MCKHTDNRHGDAMHRCGLPVIKKGPENPGVPSVVDTQNDLLSLCFQSLERSLSLRDASGLLLIPINWAYELTMKII